MSQLFESELKIDPAEALVKDILDGPGLLFSGQGAQEKDMGRDLAEADPEAMEYWKEAERISGLPLRGIYWEGGEAEMSDTRALQPTLTVVNFNLWRYFERHSLAQPEACAGHSLGEFCALVAAGVISPKSALEITSLRGRLMAEADPGQEGGMAAIVKLEEAAVAEITRESAEQTGALLVEANYNTPLQTVVSGNREAVRTACRLARERKGRGVELKVSGAFHSPMMLEANRELLPTLEKTEWRDPRFPVFCNASGKGAATAQEVKNSIVAQMISPVRWVEIIRAMYNHGIRRWVEIGPRPVLGKMVAPCLEGIAPDDENMRVEIAGYPAGVSAV